MTLMIGWQLRNHHIPPHCSSDHCPVLTRRWKAQSCCLSSSSYLRAHSVAHSACVGKCALHVLLMQGAVYQRIDQKEQTLDNIVELETNIPDWLPHPDWAMRACLRHTFTVTPPACVRVVYDSTSAEVITNGCEGHTC
jgi:hypothetical protein